MDSESENDFRLVLEDSDSETDSHSEYERGFNNELDSEFDCESNQQMGCSAIGFIYNQIYDDYWIPIERMKDNIINKRPVKPNFILPSGPMINTKDWKTVDYFLQFFPLQVFEKLVEETNRYASQFLKKSGKLTKSSRFRSWKNTDISEMMAFVALQIVMGLVNKPDIADYWEASGITQTPFFSNVMSRNRYEILSSFLHFNNNELRVPKGTPEYDPLFKIRPIIDMVMPTYLDSYCPDKNVFVDDSLVKFRGKFSYKQCKRKKSRKNGVNIWALCDATNGYMLMWKVYSCATRDPKTVKDIVVDLCQPIHNTGRTVYCDDYVSSPALFVEMKSKGLNTCGGVDPLSGRLPSEIRNKLQNLTVRRGDDPRFFFQRKTGLLACIWNDYNYISILSSFHDNQTFEVLRKIKNEFITVKKPKMVKDYNKYMKGIDLLKQKMRYYCYSSRQPKKIHVIYHFIKEVALINGHILYNSSNYVEISSKNFRKNVIYGLLTKKKMEEERNRNISDSIENSLVNNSKERLIGRHFAIKFEKKRIFRDCIVCSVRGEHRRRTRYYCPQCEGEPFMCPGICFERFHTLQNYKIKYH